MTYKLSTDGAPRIVCAGCRRLMPDYGGGFKRCASCSYGESFGKTSEGAMLALRAYERRGKVVALVRVGK